MLCPFNANVVIPGEVLLVHALRTTDKHYSLPTPFRTPSLENGDKANENDTIILMEFSQQVLYQPFSC